MTIDLTPEQEQLLKQLVDSGVYLTPEEAVRDALLSLRECEHVRQLRLEELRREIAIGLEQADRGETAPLDVWALLAESRRRLAEKEKARDGTGATYHASQPRPA